MKEKDIFKSLFLFFAIIFFFALITQAQQASLKLKVTTEQANIRLKPDIGSIIILHVPQGTILESSGKQGEWYKVEIMTEEKELASGYVHESLVIVIKPPSEKEKKEEIKKVKEPEKKEETIKAQVPPVTPPLFQPAQYLFALSLSGGGNFVHGGDLNSGAQGLADFYSDFLGREGKGKVKPTRLSYIYGGELSYALFSSLSVGLGLDYFLGKKESRVEYQKASSTDVYITRPKIWALPLRVFLSFRPLSYLYFKAGLEYFFAKCAYFYHYQRDESWQEWTGEAKAQDFGFLGGLGFEGKLSTPLSFFIEATGRHARITGFKGEDNFKNSEGLVSKEKGRLYFYQGKISGEKTYPLLFIREKKPSEAGVSDVKEATLNFSGLSLKFGLKLRF